MEAPVGEEDEVHKVVLAVKLRCLASGEEPGGLWTAEWGAAHWAFAEAH